MYIWGKMIPLKISYIPQLVLVKYLHKNIFLNQCKDAISNSIITYGSSIIVTIITDKL